MVNLSDEDGSASTSNATSLIRKRISDVYCDRYDVFLSFRGSDTRYGFTDHLYDQLKQAGIQTFRDGDELERGESLKKQLESAIKQSSVSIIVFSQIYSTSSWCLDELVKILEQKKIRGDHYKVIPIFYQVEASDVRYQKGSYEEAFNRHKAKGYVGLEKIKVWKAALTEVASFSGYSLKKDLSEVEFIAEIVSEVEKSLPNYKALSVPEHFVGNYYSANDFKSFFEDGSKDNNVLVICGIGGIGKTTIAKHLFNQYYRDFESSCFLPRITAMMSDQTNICGLQSQLLSSILNKKEQVRISSCDEGTEKIKRAIFCRKVLVVLDDVSETKQLEELLGQTQRLCAGSKIIVTTRNMSLKNDFDIEPKVHKVQILKDDDSLKLFSWHAFRQPDPKKEYVNLSKEILFRCEGLPLALEVLGSSLRKKLDIVFWNDQLRKWDEIANPNIQKVMQISYDSLEDDTLKDLFLHIACFFVGEEEEYVVKILNHLHATVGIQSLIDRCLVSKTPDSKLMMHQVIQDMGREIVRKESPNERGRRSRLWYHEDSFSVLKDDKGTEVVKGFILDGQKINKVESDGSRLATTDVNPHLITKVIEYVEKKKSEVLDRFLPSKVGELKIDSFAKMVNLELVKLNHVHLTGRCNKFPEKLRWISWHGFPLENIPMEFPVGNLVALDLQHSKLKIAWKEYKEVKSLKFLNLSYSLELRETPDFRGLLLLERLILRGCSNLVKVCKSIGILKGLVLLDLTDCRRLRDLPDLPQSIEKLDTTGCHLSEFPKKAETFDSYSIWKWASQSTVMGPVKLLACLPQFLVELDLDNCNLSDESFPNDFSLLSSLKSLRLDRNLITRLPNWIGSLSSSELLWICVFQCPHLQSIRLPSRTRQKTRVFMSDNKQLQEVEVRQDYFFIDDDTFVADYFGIKGRFKQVKAWNVENKVIKNMGLESLPISCVGKVRYEYNIFSTLVQSTRVPYCFETHLCNGADGMALGIRYTIPNSSLGADARIQGLNFCFAIRLDLDLKAEEYLSVGHFDISVVIENKTLNLKWSYRLSDGFEEVSLTENYEEAEETTIKRFLWVSTWKCEDLWKAGDKFEIYIRIEPQLFQGTILTSVEECGIRTVYEDALDYNSSISFQDSETTDRDHLLLWTDKTDFPFTKCCTPGTCGCLLGHLYFHVPEISPGVGGRLPHTSRRMGLRDLDEVYMLDYDNPKDNEEWTKVDVDDQLRTMIIHRNISRNNPSQIMGSN